MVTKTQQISIEDYNYSLPDERIAKFPLPKRDESKLLLYRDGKVSESVFKHITDYLPEGSLMVFNNTRVIQARLLFQRAKVQICMILWYNEVSLSIRNINDKSYE